jgi:hypothetical protein
MFLANRTTFEITYEVPCAVLSSGTPSAAIAVPSPCVASVLEAVLPLDVVSIVSVLLVSKGFVDGDGLLGVRSWR